MALTVGVTLIRLLEAYGVEQVFGIPGVHTIELYRGLGESTISHHTPRHEQGAGFMADGYARVSGKPGVCFVITGPGLSNLTTAMGQALADSIPMLVISSVNSPGSTPNTRGQLHEMPNQSGFVSNVARFSETIASAEDLVPALARAFSQFSAARPGPVHLEIPVPLLATAFDSVTLAQPPAPAPQPPASSLAEAAQLLNDAEQPLILSGGGCRHAANEVRLLAEQLDAPVAMTINARGVLPHAHPLAIPVSGSMQAVRDLIQQSDVILALGTELSATDYDMYRNFGFDIPGKLIRCDIDARQLHTNFSCDIALPGDTAHCTRQLHRLVEQRDRNGAQRASGACRAARAQLDQSMQKQIGMLESLRDQFPGAIWVGDSTQLIYSANLYFGTESPNHWFNSSTGFGTLGYALPAAIGASIANRNAGPIICLIGDGGLQFVLAELGSAIDANTSLVIVVWTNNGYREIKTTMQNAGTAAIGVDLVVPDFTKIANAYGMSSVVADNRDQLAAAVQRSITDQCPVLVQMDETTVMGNL